MEIIKSNKKNLDIKTEFSHEDSIQLICDPNTSYLNKISVNENEETVSSKLIFANNDANISENHSAISGKKRGRKCKFAEKRKVCELSCEELSVTRSGRKRKQINYFSLANPEELDEPDKKKNNTNSLNKGNKQSKLNNFINNISETLECKKSFFAPDVSKKFKSDVTKKNEILNMKSPNVEASQEVVKVNKHSAQFNTDVIKGELGTSNELLDDKQLINKLSKTRKYTHTGKTTQMMNTLLTLFNKEEQHTSSSLTEKQLNNNSRIDTDLNNTNDEITNVSINALSTNNISVKRRGRRKKNEILEDDSELYICGVCKEEIKKTAWSHHKQRYHNNLAWRIGEPPLDLNDQSLVTKILNLQCKKKRSLYCNKCGETKKSTVGFLSHQSVCKKTEAEIDSIRVSCEFCDKKILPVSMATHIKMVHSTPQKEVIEVVKKKEELILDRRLNKRNAAKNALKMINANVENETYYTSKLDFNSTEFKSILENESNENECIICKYDDCQFKTQQLDEILIHLSFCKFKPQKACVCKICLFVTNDTQIFEHLKTVHHITVDTGDNDFNAKSVNEICDIDDDIESEGTNVINSSTKRMPKFLKSTKKQNGGILFPDAFMWTMQFYESNLSTPLLFPNLLNIDLPILSIEGFVEFLPRMSECCDVAYTIVERFENPLEKDYIFKKYELFKTDLHENGNSTIFCGGPVISMAWLPTPHTNLNEHQILAVSVLNELEDDYRIHKNYEESSMIQFWDFNVLKNKNQLKLKPDLIFGFAHKHGPVRHMEWCPSGCYNPNINRCGLLASTGSDSYIYIYSVPFYSGNRRFYKPKPSMKLFLQETNDELLGGLKYSPVKLSWTKESGHNYLAAGYTNGMIAIFDINPERSSLYKIRKDDDNDKDEEDDVMCITPVISFQAHTHMVTALVLSHLNGGRRWLLTGSMDQTYSVWDLDNPVYPITTTKKNIVTDGVWLTNWMSHIISFDESSSSTTISTIFKQPRDYLCESSINFLNSDVTVKSISGSDWLNGIIQANEVGEIVAMFPHQLFYMIDQTKFRKHNRMLLGYTCLIEKNKTVQERVHEDKIKKENLLENVGISRDSSKAKKIKKKSGENLDLHLEEPFDYFDAKEKYGLLFCDYNMDSHKTLPSNILSTSATFPTSYHISKLNSYPLQSINKIAFNPNRQASTYYASGYEVGLVRVNWLKFLKDNPQIK